MKLKDKKRSKALRVVALSLIIASFSSCLFACGDDGEKETEKETTKKTEATKKLEDDNYDEYDELSGNGGNSNFGYTVGDESHVHAWGEWEYISKTTCTEDGKMQRSCYCGAVKEDTIPSPGHNYEEWTIEKKATCFEDGLKSSVCFCGNKTTEVIPAAHTIEKKAAQAVSCEAIGWNAYELCGECGYTDYAEIPATGHKYEKGLCDYCGGAYGHKTLSFTSNRNGTCYVSGIGTCTETDIIIPKKSPSGDLVTAIGDNAFTGSDTVVSITIPDSVTQISAMGLEGCDALETIIINEYNTKFVFEKDCLIDKDTKTLVYAMKDAKIPTDDSVAIIGAYAFSSHDSIVELVIPANIQSIEAYAFRECDEITSVTLGENVSTLGQGAFYGCDKLDSIVVSKSVTEMGDDAFLNCSALEKVYISDLASWCKIEFAQNDANPVYLAHSLYLNEHLLTEPIFSSDIEAIGSYSFVGCTSLEMIVIPSTVTSVGYYAFAECGELDYIEIPNNSLSIGGTAFSDSQVIGARFPANKASVIPKTHIAAAVITGSGDISSSAFYNCDSLVSVEIMSGVSNIGSSAFYDCDNLKNLTLSSSVSKIGENAFSECESLPVTSIDGAIYLSVGENPYYWLLEVVRDDTVTEYTLQSGLMRIADGVFDEEKVTKVVIPKSVVYIGEKTFDPKDTVTLQYEGTCAEWKQVIKYKPDIYYEFEDYLIFEFQPVVCSDGTVQPIRGYLGSQLTGNVAYVYERMIEDVFTRNPIATVYIDERENITYDEVSLAWRSFKYDFPECFWIDSARFYKSSSSSSYYKIEMEYLFSGNALDQARRALDDKLDSIIANMPSGTTWDKTLYLHDVLVKQVEYYSNSHDQTSYGGLVKNLSVCGGYATTYQLLLLEAGIKASVVTGDTSRGYHAWNAVWLDEETCVYTDATWNDWGEKYNNEIGRHYFNMSYAEMHKDHTPEEKMWPTSCNHTDQSYYDKNPNVFPVIDENSSIEYMASLFTGEGSQTRVLHCFMNVNPDTWWKNNMREIYKALGGTGSYSGSWHHYGSGSEVYLILKGTFS